MKIRFGTSGNPPNFFKSEYGKNRVNAPDWIGSIGLNAYERLMTYGARMREEDAIELGKKAKKNDIKLSVHAPYYIVFTSEKPKVVKNSVNEMLKTIHLSGLMGAKKIIFHPGFGRDFNKVIKNLKVVEKNKPEDIEILPETMGKISQLGDLNEILNICENTSCLPCIDFAHLHARNLGSLKEKEDFRKVIIEIERRLGRKAIKNLHCHFYPVDFTDKGEKAHRAVYEKNVYPMFEPFAEVITEFRIYPTLISESRDSQDIGALYMQSIMKKHGFGV